MNSGPGTCAETVLSVCTLAFSALLAAASTSTCARADICARADPHTLHRAGHLTGTCRQLASALFPELLLHAHTQASPPPRVPWLRGLPAALPHLLISQRDNPNWTLAMSLRPPPATGASKTLRGPWLTVLRASPHSELREQGGTRVPEGSISGHTLSGRVLLCHGARW